MAVWPTAAPTLTVDWGDDNSDNQATINCTDGPEDSTAYAVSDSHTC